VISKAIQREGDIYALESILDDLKCSGEHMTEATFKKVMAKLKAKAPRAGVRPTKVVPDKKKYSRKRKTAEFRRRAKNLR